MKLAMSQTSSRLLELLSLLQGRRDWPGNELADRLEVSGRRSGATSSGCASWATRRVAHRPAGGYRLRAGAAMPPLLLDDDEAIAIASGFARRRRVGDGIEETAVRALVKLEQVLPAHLRRRVGHWLGHGHAPGRGADGRAAET
jgi:predicted DNA-binding transcriptional regulator YafY